MLVSTLPTAEGNLAYSILNSHPKKSVKLQPISHQNPPLPQNKEGTLASSISDTTLPAKKEGTIASSISDPTLPTK
jgi:hypothetical protein